jgi:hypothetical protein
MADKEKEGTPTAEVTPAEIKPEELKAPTKEEIEQARSEALKFEQNWKDAQRVISKKDEEIQSLKDNQELWKAVIAVVAEKKGISEEEAETQIQQRKPNLLQQFDQIEQRRMQKQYLEKVNSYKARVEGELNLRPGDDDYDIIQSLVVAGKFDKADKRIEAIKAKSSKPQPTSEEPKETEEERVARKAKELLIKEGLLAPEGGQPSAGGGQVFTKEQIKNMPIKEYEELKPEIDKARKEGRIKD